MEIEIKKNYVVKVTHEERWTIMNALAYSIDHNVNKNECKRLFNELTTANKEE